MVVFFTFFQKAKFLSGIHLNTWKCNVLQNITCDECVAFAYNMCK